MKILANIRAKWAYFDKKHLTHLRIEYLKLNKKQQRLIKSIATILAVIFIYLFIHHCYLWIFGHKQLVRPPMVIRHGGRIEIPTGSPLRAQLELKTVELSEEPHVMTVPGWVEAIPSLNVSVFPPLSGRLTDIFVTIGDEVKAGQVLATLSAPDFAQANADYQKALSAQALADSILKRAKSVNQVGGNSLQVVQQAENDALQAQSELHRSEARLKALTMHLEKQPLANQPLANQNKASADSKDTNIFHDAAITVDDPRSGLISIRSPINGRVSSLNYGIGSYINDLTDPFMQVVNLQKVWVVANIPEIDVPSIAKGQQVDIRFLAYPKKLYQGQIRFVHPELDPDTRRNFTRIELSNPDGKLQPNMFANIRIQIKAPAQIRIPLTSVLMNNESTVVYVESSPWICQRREIELGSEDGDLVSVLSGLRPGERIVTVGGVFINDK